MTGEEKPNKRRKNGMRYGNKTERKKGNTKEKKYIYI